MIATDFDRQEREMWSGRATAYAHSFAPLCGALHDLVLDLAAVTAGTHLLDVGSGPGTLAAAAVDRGAWVTAVDAEPSMVAATCLAAPKAYAQVAVLPGLRFEDGSFTAVTANFVLNHVGDPAAAARDLVRVTAPGGVVVASIWPFPQPPLQAFWGEVVAESGVALPEAPPRVDPGRDFPRTSQGLATLLIEAGLEELRVETVSWTHRFDPEAWWSGPANGLSTLGTLMRGLPVESVGLIRAAYDRAIAARLEDDGKVGMDTAALLAYGRKPKP